MLLDAHSLTCDNSMPLGESVVGCPFTLSIRVHCGELRAYCAGFGGGIWVFRLFKGYDWVTVLVVANLAFSGLLVSWVMKFADSILKVSLLPEAL